MVKFCVCVCVYVCVCACVSSVPGIGVHGCGNGSDGAESEG